MSVSKGTCHTHTHTHTHTHLHNSPSALHINKMVVVIVRVKKQTTCDIGLERAFTFQLPLMIVCSHPPSSSKNRKTSRELSKIEFALYLGRLCQLCSFDGAPRQHLYSCNSVRLCPWEREEEKERERDKERKEKEREKSFFRFPKDLLQTAIQGATAAHWDGKQFMAAASWASV